MRKFLKFSIAAAIMLVMVFAMASVTSAADYTLYANDYVPVVVNQDQTATIGFTPTVDSIYYIYSNAQNGADPAAKLECGPQRGNHDSRSCGAEGAAKAAGRNWRLL